MSLLDNASLLLTPNAVKASKLYSVIPSNGNGDFTATRATTATRINPSGLVESVALNVLRLDYSLGGCPNILLEPQRTNLALQSSSFDSASWTKNQSSVTANSTTSPSGVVDADTLTADGSSNVHQVVSNSISFTSATSYTLTAYAKKNTNNFVQIYVAASVGGMFANFDLNNGVVGTLGTITGTAPTSSITSVGNGWYRCSMTFTAAAAASAAFALLISSSASAARLETNTLSTSVFLWGAQLEAGAYATSYIPTTTASVTRNADSITRNNIFTNGLITAAGGTWFVELRNNVVQNSGYAQAQTFGLGTGVVGASANNFWLQALNGQRISIWKQVAGSATVIRITAANTCKIAIKWNGSTADVFENGVKVVSATAFTATALEELRTFVTTNTYFINEMALFPTPLTDAQCLALTA